MKSSRSLSTPVSIAELTVLRRALNVFYYSPGTALWRASELRLFLKQDTLPPIVDLGCGDGRFGSLLFQDASDLIGIDLDESALLSANARKCYKDVFRDDITQLRCLPSNHFNSAISNCVLEHIEDVENVLSAVYRVLRNSGTFSFTVVTPTLNTMVPSVRLLKLLRLDSRVHKRIMTLNQKYHHVSLLTESAWRDRITQAGFSINESIGYASSDLVQIWEILETVFRSGKGKYNLANVCGKLFMTNKQIPSTLFFPLLRKIYMREIYGNGVTVCRFFTCTKNPRRVSA